MNSNFHDLYLHAQRDHCVEPGEVELFKDCQDIPEIVENHNDEDDSEEELVTGFQVI
jgi:hypothetical protein